MRSTIALVAGIAVLAGGQLLLADEPNGSKNPYSRLFQPQDLKAQAQQLAAQAAATNRSRVVCGMTLIPADPKIDPKMQVPRDDNDKTRYTIRAVPPPICK